MKSFSRLALMGFGAAVGVVAAMAYIGSPKPAVAGTSDRFQDSIMVTGAVQINARVQTDGVWLLDYKAGKLLGTVVDRQSGKLVGWSEVDLRTEFNLVAQQDVHFMMTTGYVTQGQSALYLAETATGQFGVYTMGTGPGGNGIVIRRHDMTRYRNAGVAPAAAQGGPLAVDKP